LKLRVSNGGSGIRKNSDAFELASHRNSCEFRYCGPAAVGEPMDEGSWYP